MGCSALSLFYFTLLFSVWHRFSTSILLYSTTPYTILYHYTFPHPIIHYPILFFLPYMTWLLYFVLWFILLYCPVLSSLLQSSSPNSSVVTAASLFRPVLGSIPGSNTELERRSVNPSLQSGNRDRGSECGSLLIDNASFLFNPQSLRVETIANSAGGTAPVALVVSTRMVHPQKTRKTA